MSGELDQLLEMGWAKEYAEVALKATDNQGLQAALEWILDNPPEEPNKTTTVNEGDFKTNEQPLTSLTAQSYKCEECEKRLKCEEEVHLHSARTGHVNFTESSDAIKVLTETEKQAQIKRIHDYMAIKKVERAEQERIRQIEDERRRRAEGKTLISAKQKFQEDEMRRLAEQMKRDKLEDKAHRERVKAQIAVDREEKLKRETIEKAAAAGTSIATPQPYPLQITPSDKSTECRLQIRTPIGPPIVANFRPNEPLAAVALYVSQHWSDAPAYGLDTREIILRTTFPSRQFSEDDLSKSLDSLGLCPSAVIIAVHKPAS